MRLLHWDGNTWQRLRMHELPDHVAAGLGSKAGPDRPVQRTITLSREGVAVREERAMDTLAQQPAP